MNNDFWGPVFAKLHENIELLKLICHDTSDQDLISWLKPNPFLWTSCARFIRKKKITNKNGLIEKIIDFARKDANLRKIIFFNWVEKNSKTMAFTGLRSDDAAFEKLLSGEFGNKEKIEILSFIDPRPGMDKFYKKYFETRQLSEAMQENTAPQPAEEKTVKFEKFNNLQKQNEQLNFELKDLRQSLKKNSNEVKALQNNLRDKDKKIQKLKNFVSDLEKQIEELNRQLVTNENKDPEITEIRVSEKLELTNKLNSLSQALNKNESRLKELKKQLDTKDRLIQRLEDKVKSLKAQQHNFEDQERKISNLQNLLNENHDEGAYQNTYGQIINFETDSNSLQWLLDEFGGELLELPEKLLVKNQIALNEYCCAYLDDRKQIKKLLSLEKGKKIISGYFNNDRNNLVLVGPEKDYQVFCEVEEKYLLLPVKAIYLAGQGNREPGIYGFSLLENQRTDIENVINTVALPTILKFLRLKNYSRSRLLKELEKISIKAEPVNSNKIKFENDYRQALNSARLRLPLTGVCSDPECFDKLEQNQLARDLRANEKCQVCGKIETPESNLPQYDFGGRKIIILGGDYVGTDYVESLKNFNLDVTWVSGFESSGKFLSRLENYDLIIIIIKQISHTLLREITKKIRNISTPLFYSKRRGTSGLLNELIHHYKPGTN
ncbi:MAG: coiled-coil domain-containing protein [Candidatus Rifleibacteriota bacterium]